MFDKFQGLFFQLAAITTPCVCVLTPKPAGFLPNCSLLSLKLPKLAPLSCYVYAYLLRCDSGKLKEYHKVTHSFFM